MRWATAADRLGLVLGLAVVVGCSGYEKPPDDDTDCRSGASRSCNAGSECARGEQTCTSGNWDVCECVERADAGTLPQLGGSCSANDDCPDDAFCLSKGSARFFGGGPPTGVCVADCSDDADACGAFREAVCVAVTLAKVSSDDDAGIDDDAGVDLTREALCFERCALGSSSEPKCHDRGRVACEALSEGSAEGFCRPVCTMDDDCGDRTCDPRTGACIDAPAVTDPSFGRACDPDQRTGECEGLCVDLDDDYAVCSHRCVFGEPGDCTGAPSAPRGGCVFASEGGSIGDVGFCGELCDCPEQCSAPEAVCDGFTDDELVRVLGRKGVCTSEGLSVGEPITCK